MARGCITIASRMKDLTGVEGDNGFLCEAGNADELTQIIIRIKNLSQTERKEFQTEISNCQYIDR